jgi:hypothetical protein
MLHLGALERLCRKASGVWAKAFAGQLGRRVLIDDTFVDPLERVRVKPVIPPSAALLAGEAAYNFRAALDYAVGQVSIWRLPPPPGTRRRSQFPIERSRTKFLSRRHTFMEGLEDRDVVRLEECQPYRGCEWTAHLAALSNLDKHADLVDVGQGVSLSFPEEPRRKKPRMIVDAFLVTRLQKNLKLVETLEGISYHVQQLLFEISIELPE